MVTQEDIEVRLADSYEAGEAKGIAIGREEGRLKGRVEEKREIAKSMIQNGLSISMVSNISGLSEEEIKAL